MKQLISNTTTIATYLFNNFCCFCVSPIKYIFIFIHPYFCKANLIPGNHLSPFWKSMGALAAKHMTHNWARYNFQLPPTLPHLKNTELYSVKPLVAAIRSEYMYVPKRFKVLHCHTDNTKTKKFFFKIWIKHELINNVLTKPRIPLLEFTRSFYFSILSLSYG